MIMSPNTSCHSYLVPHLSIHSKTIHHCTKLYVSYLALTHCLLYIGHIILPTVFNKAVVSPWLGEKEEGYSCMSFISFCAITFHGWLILLNESLGVKRKKICAWKFLSLWNSLYTRAMNCLLSSHLSSENRHSRFCCTKSKINSYNFFLKAWLIWFK